jgi:serine/threonine protein phosphatase PrpC
MFSFLRPLGNPDNKMGLSSSPSRLSLLQANAKTMHLEVAACTDKGRIRPTNEDSYHVSREKDLFVLSDGMGGAAKGEVASAMAVEVVSACFEADPVIAVSREPTPGSEFSGETTLLIRAVQKANRKIHEAGTRDPAARGMGATIVAARISGSSLSLAHVGDSRAYLLRAHTLQQLTSDHSLVAEQVRQGLMTDQQAAVSELQSVLTRALGMEESVEVDADEMELFPGDSLLLCSDGLTRMVPEYEVAGILSRYPDVRTAAERLVERANECGGHDNVTVVVVRISKPKGWFARFFPWGSANLA